MMKLMKPMIVAVALTGVATLSGCSSVSTAIEKKDLSVQTKMSDTIFLEPVSARDKVVFVQLRSTSDQKIDADKLATNLKSALVAKGYSITDDMDKANFVIQQNILSVAKVDPKSAYSAVQAGFGGAVVGGTIGALAGSRGNYGRTTSIGGLIGAGIGLAANALIKDVYYNMVTDLQIRQRVKGNNKVEYTKQAESKIGSSAAMTQKVSGTSNWMTYRTRIVSVANKVNLDFSEAKTPLEMKTLRSVAGIF